jgi:hypothetical protein
MERRAQKTRPAFFWDASHRTAEYLRTPDTPSRGDQTGSQNLWRPLFSARQLHAHPFDPMGRRLAQPPRVRPAGSFAVMTGEALPPEPVPIKLPPLSLGQNPAAPAAELATPRSQTATPRLPALPKPALPKQAMWVPPDVSMHKPGPQERAAAARRQRLALLAAQREAQRLGTKIQREESRRRAERRAATERSGATAIQAVIRGQNARRAVRTDIPRQRGAARIQAAHRRQSACRVARADLPRLVEEHARRRLEQEHAQLAHAASMFQGAARRWLVRRRARVAAQRAGVLRLQLRFRARRLRRELELRAHIYSAHRAHIQCTYSATVVRAFHTATLCSVICCNTATL